MLISKRPRREKDYTRGTFFAWFPVRTEDGELVWWERVWWQNVKNYPGTLFVYRIAYSRIEKGE